MCLSAATINGNVGSKSAGAYALGRTLNSDGSMPVNYIGRADADVNARLQQHAVEGKYKYFAFIYCAGASAAYQRECELYHLFGNLDNVNHPGKVNSWDKCPKCGA